MIILLCRVTAVRKCSGGHNDGVGGAGGGKGGEGTSSEAGTLHTKRHSGDHHDIGPSPTTLCSRAEQRSAPGSLRSISSLGSGVSSVIAAVNSHADQHTDPHASHTDQYASHTMTPASAARSSRPASSLAPNSAATSNNMEDNEVCRGGRGGGGSVLARLLGCSGFMVSL